jgi:hypothetical protein
MTKQGHYVRGVEQAASKLQPADVVRMRELRADHRATLKELSEQFGVSTNVVHRVVTGKGWKHVEGPIQEPRSYIRERR